MAEVIGERLKELIRLRETSQSAVAEAIGVTQPTIGRLCDGTTRETGKLLELAVNLKTTPEYLTGWTDERDLSEEIEGQRAGIRSAAVNLQVSNFDAALDMVMVREADLVLGLGGSFLQAHVEERLIPFPRDWLRQYTDADPSMLAFIKLRGDSMTPTIVDGSMGLLDLSRTRLDEQDELWAIAYGDIGMVKRLRQMPDGTVKIMSDNPVVHPEIATDGELFIIGRCCGIFKKT